MGVAGLGANAGAAPSTSGSIVFDSDVNDGHYEGAYYQIHIMNADGSHLTRIATPMSAEAPAFSPDGRRVAFVSPDSPITADIYIMNVDGSSLTRLISLEGIVLFSPVFSPDGRRIAFAFCLIGAPGLIGAPEVLLKPCQIEIMDADGSHLTRLTKPPGNAIEPAFSPDGRKIVFTRVDPRPGELGDHTQIDIMNVDGSHRVRLIDPPGGAVSPTFSRDGRIAFVSTSGIYTMNVDGSHVTRLPAPDGMPRGAIAHPKFSPDGRKIAFSYFDYEQWTSRPTWQIYIMDADGSHLTRLTDPDHPVNNAGRGHNLSFGP